MRLFAEQVEHHGKDFPVVDVQRRESAPRGGRASSRRRHVHATCMWGFCDLKQDGAGLQISDLETDEVNVVDIILWFAQVPCKDDRQTSSVGFIYVHIFA